MMEDQIIPVLDLRSDVISINRHLCEGVLHQAPTGSLDTHSKFAWFSISQSTHEIAVSMATFWFLSKY